MPFAIYEEVNPLPGVRPLVWFRRVITRTRDRTLDDFVTIAQQAYETGVGDGLLSEPNELMALLPPSEVEHIASGREGARRVLGEYVQFAGSELEERSKQALVLSYASFDFRTAEAVLQSDREVLLERLETIAYEYVRNADNWSVSIALENGRVPSDWEPMEPVLGVFNEPVEILPPSYRRVTDDVLNFLGTHGAERVPDVSVVRNREYNMRLLLYVVNDRSPRLGLRANLGGR